jgi:hypothetical protein
MGLLELFRRSDRFMEFLPVKILVTWPEGTEYLSNGPFFEEEK